MFNKAVLMGRICNDLELKTIQSGDVKVLSFRLAVDRSYQAKGEERKSDFFNIVAWRSTAEFISKYFAKGRMILVEGELQTRQYVDKNGNNQNIVELVVNNAHFTGEPKASSYSSYGAPPPPTTAPPSSHDASAISSGSVSDFVEADSDDDYPF